MAKRQRRSRQPFGLPGTDGALLRIAALTRISTDEVNQPYSLEAQGRGLDQYVGSQPNMEITHRFVDQASGATLQRPGLQAALMAARAGEFDVLLVYRIDRLTRSIVGLMQIVEQLEACGVALRSATEPIDTQGPVGRMLLQLLGIFAEFERGLLIDRIEAGFERKAARGEWLGGRAPFGFSLDSPSKTLLIDQAEAAVVRTVFAKFVNEHLGSTTITTWLNDNGRRTRSGTVWTNQRVLRMLQNPVYIGKISHDGVVHEGKHEPIIDLEMWKKAEALTQERSLATATRAPNDSSFLLSGLVRCKECSNSYVAVSANGRSGSYRYYTCRTRQTRGNHTCRSPRIPANDLETATLAALRGVYTNHNLFLAGLNVALVDAKTEKPRVEAELASAEHQLRETTAAIDRYLQAFETGAISAEVCGERIDHLTARRAELTAHRDDLATQLTQMTPAIPTIASLDDAAAMVDAAVSNGQPTAIKHLLRQFIDRIEIDANWQAHPTYLVPEPPMAEPSARPSGTPVRINEPFVEVPGIEPGSFVASMGLLRAQCAVPLLGPTDHAHESV